MKDNFSEQSDKYLKYRPAYPNAFFDYLKKITTGFENAWDCGTGNGQVAVELAKMFRNVYATDISQSQLENAVQLSNIHYSVQPAEKTNFSSDFFDLIIVAQAVHWFDFDLFYAEVERTAKNNAHLVILGYGRLTISEQLDQVIDKFYHDIIGHYWDKERKHIDEGYRTIPFPFAELDTPAFQHSCEWTLEHLVGYLETWSAVKHYKKSTGRNPVDLISNALEESWGQKEKRTINFPLLLRIGTIRK